MAQPKNPPLSVRLPPWLLEEIKAAAAAKGLAVNAELVAVLTQAYRLGEKLADSGATPAQVGEIGAKAKRVPVVTKAPSFKGLTAAGEPLPERKPYQKGSKR